MSKILRKLLPLLIVLAIAGCSARRTPAQFIGYTGPQTVNQNVWTAASCASTLSSAPMPNVGQSVHVVTFTLSGSSQQGQLLIQGSTTGASYTQISDDGMLNPGVVIGYGSYPFIRVQVINGGAGCTVTANYAGTSVSPLNLTGTAGASAYQKNVFVGQTAGANQNTGTFSTPYGSTAGVIVFTYAGGTGPAGSIVQVSSSDTNTNTSFAPFSFTLATANTTPQFFVVPNLPASRVFVSYQSGGASSSTILASYYFLTPGAQSQNPPCEQTAIINTAAAGPTRFITNSTGTVRICSISVSSGTAEAVDFQQGTGTNCGTGNSQLTGVYHLAVNTPGTQVFPQFGLLAKSENDVCIHLSGANQTDGTITFSDF